jgi:hypothetical protein
MNYHKDFMALGEEVIEEYGGAVPNNVRSRKG